MPDFHRSLFVAVILFVALSLPVAVNRNRLSLVLARTVTNGWCDNAAIAQARHLVDLGQGFPSAALGADRTGILNRLDALAMRCGSDDMAVRQNVEVALARAEQCRLSGDNQCAANESRMALKANRNSVAAYWSLYMANKALGLADEAAIIAHEVEGLVPEYQLTQSSVISNVTLLGYDVDRASLEFGNEVRATLYWQLDPSVDSEFRQVQNGSQTQFAVGSRLYQVVTTNNLVWNGGFEQTLGNAGLSIAGFAQDRYGADISGHRLAVVSRDGTPTNCAELTNQGSGNVVSGYLSSIQINVNSAEQYLAGAWVDSQDETAHVGVLFQWPAVEASNAYVPITEHAGKWVYRTGVINVPRGAEWLRVQLLNQKRDSAVCFDDVFLLRMDPPRAPYGTPQTPAHE